MHRTGPVGPEETIMDIKLSEKQTKNLKTVIGSGKVSIKDLDGRSVNALEARGLVKVSYNTKGTWVSPTAKGKKLN
jgi:hypothetical protein